MDVPKKTYISKFFENTYISLKSWICLKLLYKIPKCINVPFLIIDQQHTILMPEFKHMYESHRKEGTKQQLYYQYFLGGIASICSRFNFQQTLQIQIQGSQGSQKIRKVVRNSKLPIARSTIHPSLSKIKNNLPFFKEF